VFGIGNNEVGMHKTKLLIRAEVRKMCRKILTDKIKHKT
jgi:hypothetical protein